MSQKTHTIDATGKRLGHLASEVAALLMGKDSVSFVRHMNPDVKVVVENANKLDISKKKREQKTYISHSGYPGGQKERTMEKVIATKGMEEVIRKAVYGMLPGNRLRKDMMKRLEVSE